MCFVYTKTEFNFTATVDRHTQYLSIPSVSSVSLLLWRAFCPLSKWRLEQWHPCKVPIRQWGPGLAPTDDVSHYCVIGQCVGVMVAHRVSQMVVFFASHPAHPTPPHHPSHPLPLLSILTAERMAKMPWNSAIRDREG